MKTHDNQKIILVPFDFSEVSRNAVRYAVELAKNKHAKVVLLHAFYTTDNLMNLSGQMLAENMVGMKEDADKMLKKAGNELIPADVQHEMICNYGFVINQISEYVSDNRTWLIIMGTEGATGIKEFFGGSTTAEVVEKIEVPVLAIPKTCHYTPIESIAFATDFHDSDVSSAIYITRLAKLFDAKIHFIHYSEGVFIPEHDKFMMDDFEKELRACLNFNEKKE
jgi:nucleotide-binding universal stress UspA family protein